MKLQSSVKHVAQVGAKETQYLKQTNNQTHKQKQWFWVPREGFITKQGVKITIM